MRRASECKTPRMDEQDDKTGHESLPDRSNAMLVEAIQHESGKECFASDKFYACPDIECKWRLDCRRLNEIWLL